MENVRPFFIVLLHGFCRKLLLQKIKLIIYVNNSIHYDICILKEPLFEWLGHTSKRLSVMRSLGIMF